MGGVTIGFFFWFFKPLLDADLSMDAVAGGGWLRIAVLVARP